MVLELFFFFFLSLLLFNIFQTFFKDRYIMDPIYKQCYTQKMEGCSSSSVISHHVGGGRLQRARPKKQGDQGGSDLAMIKVVKWCSYITGLKSKNINKNYHFSRYLQQVSVSPLFILQDWLLSPSLNVIFCFLLPYLYLPKCLHTVSLSIFCFVCFYNNEINASEIPFFLQLS